MQLTLFFENIRNVNWPLQRYYMSRIEELKELEKQRQETRNRSKAAKDVWDERKKAEKEKASRKEN